MLPCPLGRFAHPAATRRMHIRRRAAVRRNSPQAGVGALGFAPCRGRAWQPCRSRAGGAGSSLGPVRSRRALPLRSSAIRGNLLRRAIARRLPLHCRFSHTTAPCRARSAPRPPSRTSPCSSPLPLVTTSLGEATSNSTGQLAALQSRRTAPRRVTLGTRLRSAWLAINASPASAAAMLNAQPSSALPHYDWLPIHRVEARDWKSCSIRRCAAKAPPLR